MPQKITFPTHWCSRHLILRRSPFCLSQRGIHPGISYSPSHGLGCAVAPQGPLASRTRTTAYARVQFFSTGSILFKKGKGSQNEPKTTDSASGKSSDDPLDTTKLDAEIHKAIERLVDDLSKLRGGGRFSPELVESLRVHLVKGSKETARLGDVAQVIPKGRVLSVIVGEKEHVKPITSAILSSDHSLNPTPPTPEAPTTITVPVPPPTSESRQAIVASVGKSAEVANNAIRNARQSHHKRLRALQLERKIRPDDLRKANAAMEKTVEKGVAEVKKVADRARKTLESQ